MQAEVLVQAPTLVFRQARSSRELVDLFRLRQRLIEETRHRGVLPEAAPGIGFCIDPWDVHAHHFGLFISSECGETPVGYERGVMLEEGPNASEVRAIANQYGLSIPPRPARFPFLVTFEGEARAKLEEFERTRIGRALVESTSFVIDHSARSPRVARFFVDATLATYFFNLNFAVGLTVTSVQHEPFYRRAGFHNQLGEPAYAPKADQEAAALVVTPDSLSAALRQRLERYGDELRHQGFVASP